ncbi:MAG: CapA family protein [Firmicutes bacterium]|nr:CapA family protein [Bacillota bacterium]
MIKRVIGFIMIIMLSFTNATQINDKQNDLQPNDLKPNDIIQQMNDLTSKDISTAPSNFLETNKILNPIENTKEEPSIVENIESDNTDKPGGIDPIDEKIQIDDEEPVEIIISYAGDCTIGTDESFSYTNSFPYRFDKVGNDNGYFFDGVSSIFQEDDLTLVNLETTFTTATKKAEKKFRFKGPPSYVNILTEGSVEMVNISNNHIYDYLGKGFNETLKTLDDAGIAYSGEGVIAYFETHGITIASIGYNGWNTGIKKSVSKDIAAARAAADIVIVSFHWGIERTFYPNTTQTSLGRYAIDQGADVVVGHHPHVIQGVEKYNGKYIVYSLGNFCFGGNRNPAEKDTFIFQTRFVFESKNQVEEVKAEGVIIPCRISSVNNVNDYQPTIIKDKERDRIIGRILNYSRKLKYGIKKEDVIFQ